MRTALRSIVPAYHRSHLRVWTCMQTRVINVLTVFRILDRLCLLLEWNVPKKIRFSLLSFIAPKICRGIVKICWQYLCKVFVHTKTEFCYQRLVLLFLKTKLTEIIMGPLNVTHTFYKVIFCCTSKSHIVVTSWRKIYVTLQT